MPGYIGVIVESPSKCSKIESYLGPGYKCAATYGHIRVVQSLDDVDCGSSYQPRFRDSPSKRTKVASLSRFITCATSILLATDDDREGEAIAWHICDRFGLDVSTTPRIVFHEVTKTALQAAVASPTLVNMNLVRAQQARQVLDLLVGFTVSPLLWRGVESKRNAPLSAGRCQSPALRLVYDNQCEIDKAPGEGVYATTGYFTSKSIELPLIQGIETNEDALDFVQRSVLFTHKHSKTDPSISKRSPPLPFSTSLLQQKASSELKLTPKDTMEACQVLYEQGLITYHRTDMQLYAGEFTKAAATFIEGKYGRAYTRSVVGKQAASDTAQAAHEAIRPTSITVPIPAGVDGKALRVYKLVYRNTLESCMADARYETFKWTVTAPPLQTHSQPVYRRLFEKQVFDGWQAVAGKERGDCMYGYILSLSKGDVGLTSLVSTYTIKKLRQHLTEAKLVSALEKAGIGRPSTFSSLVDKIQSRKYVKKQNITGRTLECPKIALQDGVITRSSSKRTFGEEKGKLVLQELGRAVMAFLISNFDSVFQYDFTKDMEGKLDDIARGTMTHAELCKECHDSLTSVIEATGLDSHTKLRIDEDHTYIIGKYGPCVMYSKGEETKFLRIKPGVTRRQIVSEGLTLDQIVDRQPKQATVTAGVSLGSHLGHEAYLKDGKFGPYVRWNDKNYKWKSGEHCPPTPSELAALLSPEIRLTSTMVIKRGPYGPYILRRGPSKGTSFISIPREVDAADVNAVRTWLIRRAS